MKLSDYRSINKNTTYCLQKNLEEVDESARVDLNDYVKLKTLAAAPANYQS